MKDELHHVPEEASGEAFFYMENHVHNERSPMGWEKLVLCGVGPIAQISEQALQEPETMDMPEH